MGQRLWSEEEAKREILNYFLCHPKAADSLEGIAGWRLAEEAVCRKVEETHRAVRWLVAQGYLEEVHTRSAGAIFALNLRRLPEAERFLAAPLGEGPRDR